MKKGLLEKVILSGLGLASLTQEKAQKLVDELVKEGEVSEKDGAIMAKRAMDNLEKSRKEMENKVDKAVKEIVAKANIPSKKDIAALEKKIDELTKRLENKKPEEKSQSLTGGTGKQTGSLETGDYKMGNRCWNTRY